MYKKICLSIYLSLSVNFRNYWLKCWKNKRKMKTRYKLKPITKSEMWQTFISISRYFHRNWELWHLELKTCACHISYMKANTFGNFPAYYFTMASFRRITLKDRAIFPFQFFLLIYIRICVCVSHVCMCVHII